MEVGETWMGKKFRNSGVNIIGNVTWGSSFCQFYRKNDDLMEILVPYLKTGLENNEMCIYIISDLLNINEIEEILRESIFEFETYLKKGQIEIVSYTSWYLKNKAFNSKEILKYWAEKLHQALVNGYEGLRAVEDIPRLKKRLWEDYLAYKENLNFFLNKNPILLLSSCSLDKFNAAEMSNIISNHQLTLIRNKEKWQQIGNSEQKNNPLLIKSEEKMKNFSQESEAIRFHLDTILKYLPVGVIIAEAPSGKLLIANEWIKKIFHGNLPLSESIEEYKAYSGYHPDGRRYSEEEWPLSRAVGKGEEVIGEEIEVELTGGARRIMSVSAAPIRDAKGRIINGVVVDEDITERKLAEEALEHERSLLESIMKATDFMLAFFDPKFNFVWVNPAYAESSQMKPEEMIGKNHFELYPDVENEEIFRKVRDTGEAVFYKDKPFVYPDQPERGVTYWDWSLVPVKNYFGDVTGLVFSLRETTKYKQAEEALQKSEEHYRMLFTNMTEAFFLAEVICDKYENPCDYRFLELNPAFESHVGIKKEDVLGKSHLEVFRNANPAVLQKYGEVALSGKPAHFEFFSQSVNKYISIYAFSPEKGKFAAIFTDITEQKQIEKELHASEEKYRNIVETANEGIWIVDSEARTTFVNRKMAEMLGHTQEEMVGKSGRDFTDEEGKKISRQNMQKRQEGINETHEFKLIRKDGTPLWVLINARSLFDKNGKFVGSMSMLTDITPRKEAEAKLKETLDNLETLVKERTAELERAYESLKESERGLAEAQRMAHLGNWEWNLRNGKIYWSEEIYHIFGLQPRGSGLQFNEFLSYVHPDDRDYVSNAVKKDTGGGSCDIDFKIVLDNGEERIVHAVNELACDEKNSPFRLKGIVQDITERKKTEEKIQTLAHAVESSNDAIIIKSLNGIITSWNKGAEKLYGYSGEEILGKEISILEPANLKGQIKRLTEQIKNNKDIKHYETLRLKKDGTVINVSVTLSPILNSTGGLMAISAITRDITERIKAEQALAKIENAKKKELHHRIKNNLQVISSLLDFQAEKLTYKKNVPISEILEGFRDIQNRIISISLIHEGLYKENQTDILDFSPYVKKLTDNLCKTYNKDKNIRLNLELEENILFDMDTAIPLGMVINELITNSFKYAYRNTETGEIQIRLFRQKYSDDLNREKPSGQDTEYVLIVSDNGIGIPQDICFENSDTLGLQLVNILVDQLDGEIELNINYGTEFVIKFSTANP